LAIQYCYRRSERCRIYRRLRRGTYMPISINKMKINNGGVYEDLGLIGVSKYYVSTTSGNAIDIEAFKNAISLNYEDIEISANEWVQETDSSNYSVQKTIAGLNESSFISALNVVGVIAPLTIETSLDTLKITAPIQYTRDVSFTLIYSEVGEE